MKFTRSKTFTEEVTLPVPSYWRNEPGFKMFAIMPFDKGEFVIEVSTEKVYPFIKGGSNAYGEILLHGLTSGFVQTDRKSFDRAFSISADNFHLSRATLQEKWSLVDEMKRTSTINDIYNRMARAVEKMLEQGVQAVGTFIDVDVRVAGVTYD